jgi:hypothetical protein
MPSDCVSNSCNGHCQPSQSPTNAPCLGDSECASNSCGGDHLCN